MVRCVPLLDDNDELTEPAEHLRYLCSEYVREDACFLKKIVRVRVRDRWLGLRLGLGIGVSDVKSHTATICFFCSLGDVLQNT